MRRHLSALLTTTALTLLTSGCHSSPDLAGGATGAGGAGGESESSSSGSGSGTGSPPPPVWSEASLTDADNEGLFACNPDMQPFAPVQLSVPMARAMASATQVRGILLPKSGSAAAPPPSLVNSGEIFNYYHITYPVKESSELGIVTQLVATDKVGDYLLQIAVQAPTAPAPRAPTSVTVLVDTSTSMEGEPMSRANNAVLALASSLHKGDVLTFLTTDSDFAPVRRRALSEGDPKLFQKEDWLTVRGAGGLGRALERAYQEAGAPENHLDGGLDRLVVITDGGAAVSAIDTKSIAQHWDEEHIQLVGVGVGSAAGYRNGLLDAATTAGHGPSLYLDSVEEATPALRLRFDEVMDVAASDLHISFTLPWIFKPVTAETTNPADDGKELTVSDLARGRSMIFRRHISVCGSIDLAEAAELPIEVTATWKAGPGADSPLLSKSSSTLLKDARLASQSPQMLKASAILAFASALQSLDVTRLHAACKKAQDALFLTPAAPNDPVGLLDPEMDSILNQIKAHPLLGDANLPCK